MIADNIHNASYYYNVHKRFKKAFDFLKSVDLNTCTEGTYVIDENIKMIISSNTLKNKCDSLLETHQKYIDIHIPLSQSETFGWKSAIKLEKSLGKYDSEKDFELFEDQPTSYFTIQPGEFTIFLSNDGHAPLTGEGELKKIIFKIFID